MIRRFLIVALSLITAAALPAPLGALAATPMRIASDISYAPLEFYPPNSHSPAGFDVEFAGAIGKHLNRPVMFANHDFGTILADLAAGTYDLVLSAVSDTRARERSVDFVDYLLVGSGILTKAGNPAHITDLASLCGYTVDLQQGSSQESALEVQGAKCRAIGLKPPTVLAEATDEAALHHLQAGESVAHISDYPTVAYLAQTLGGGHAFDVAGKQFGLVPYGIGIAKTNPGLRDAVQRALAAMVADGSYDALITKWHLRQAAFRSATINAGAKY